MSEERCEKTTLLTSQCAHCQSPQAKPEPKRAVRGSRPFAARFDSDCGECAADIWEGEMIVMVDGLGAVHESCFEEMT